MDQRDKDWWRHGVFYQVYPRSFRDSDGDGVGDLRGTIARLPYLKSLGIDAVWLSPIFPSPMADFGYDISDYTGIDPLFGTMEDFDAVVNAAHENGLKLILDLVPNHTSDQHPWFAEARSARDNPKRDWYIWRDPAPDGGVPNNWLSEFGGSAWQYDDATGQYYYHAFLAAQPDLNWRNPGDLRCDAVLAGQGRRRLSRRRDLAPDQGRIVLRQSAQPALCRWPSAARTDFDALFHRSAGGAGGGRGNAPRHR
jgi:alpha-glucosidase